MEIKAYFYFNFQKKHEQEKHFFIISPFFLCEQQEIVLSGGPSSFFYFLPLIIVQFPKISTSLIFKSVVWGKEEKKMNLFNNIHIHIHIHRIKCIFDIYHLFFWGFFLKIFEFGVFFFEVHAVVGSSRLRWNNNANNIVASDDKNFLRFTGLQIWGEESKWYQKKSEWWKLNVKFRDEKIITRFDQNFGIQTFSIDPTEKMIKPIGIIEFFC